MHKIKKTPEHNFVVKSVTDQAMIGRLWAQRCIARQIASPTSFQQDRHFSKLDFEDTEEIQKTTISFLSRGGGPIELSGCIKGGFRFQERYVLGSIALLPSTILKWKAEKIEDINVESLTLFSVLYPKLEMLIVGTGNKIERVAPEVVKEMTQRGVVLEIQDTKNACGVYNLLKEERSGSVAAALLPLSNIETRTMPNAHKRKRLKASIVT